MPIRRTALLAAALAAGLALTQSVTGSGQPRAGGSPVTVVRELPDIAGTPSGQPQLAADASGRVVLSWMERIGDTPRYAFRYAFRDGDRWSDSRTIVERDSFFVNWADVPSLFPVGRGKHLIAHWLQKKGTGTYAYDVRLAISDADARAWAPDFTPYNDPSETEHGFVSFFDWPGGGAGVVWLDGRGMTSGDHSGHGGGGMSLRAARVGDDGRLTHEARIDDRVCECCPTAAVATARGAVVAYRDRSDAEIRDIAVLRLENNRWEGPTYVHADQWQINACPVNGPALAALGDRVALAWFTAEGDTPRALVAFSTDGGRTFGKPARVNDAQTLGRVDTVMLEDGRAVVSWLEFLPGGAEFRARTVSPDGTRGPFFTIATSTSDRQSGYPRMVRSGRDLVFAWTATRPATRVKTAVATLP